MSRHSFPALRPGQWALLGFVVLVVAAVFADVAASLPGAVHRGGPASASLDGRYPAAPLRVGQSAVLVFALTDTGGTTLSPACVTGNLTPAFRVLRVTFLGTAASPWRGGRSCAGILEPHSTVPVQLTVVPRFPGRYAVVLRPAAGSRVIGVGNRGTLVVRP
ncbi:MAG TPA: hypothetical protein VMW49_02360 [Candidatus Dormibacteraeota bacterium]|nr:hypothetical protein [Candidatus Dormibacteraeota bacterium]